MPFDFHFDMVPDTEKRTKYAFISIDLFLPRRHKKTILKSSVGVIVIVKDVLFLVGLFQVETFVLHLHERCRLQLP